MSDVKLSEERGIDRIIYYTIGIVAILMVSYYL